MHQLNEETIIELIHNEQDISLTMIPHVLSAVFSLYNKLYSFNGVKWNHSEWFWVNMIESDCEFV